MPIFHDHLEQGSADWLAFRRNKISATDVATIMGQNPYKTPYQLWQEKLGLKESEKENDAMRRGKDLEPIALHLYCTLKKCTFTPAVVSSKFFPWAIASLDGISESNDAIVEIKCMGEKNHEEAMTGNVKPLYMYQMLWQMFVTGLHKCDYFVYSENSHLIIEVSRNQELIEDMIIAAQDFLKCLHTLTPPPLTDRDYVDRSNDDYLSSLLDHYSLASKNLKDAEKCVDHWKNCIVEYCQKQNTICTNGKVTRVATKGRVKYDSIPELKDIDLDKYRGDDIISFRITSI